MRGSSSSSRLGSKDRCRKRFHIPTAVRVAERSTQSADSAPAVSSDRGTTMKDFIANLLVKDLEARGVQHIFGLCGHTNIAVLAALEKSSIRFVNTRHE